MSSPNADDSARRRRWQLITLGAMYACYAALMFCRSTLIAASPAMVRDPTLGLDKARFGRLMSWHSAGAIAGKVVTGVTADRIGGRNTFLLALLFTGVSTAAFGMVSPFYLFALLNFAGQFFKAGGWPAMAKIIGDWYAPRQHGRVWSIISTSSRVGAMGAGILLGTLLLVASWRTAFFTSAGVAVGVVVIGYFWLKERPSDVGVEVQTQPEPEELDAAPAPHALDEATLGQACIAFLLSPRVWLICFGMAFLSILMDFINFVPLYLSESLELEPGQAAMSGSTFPAGMFLALIATSAFYDRLSKRQLVWTLGGLIALSTGCALLLWALPELPLPVEARLAVAIATIFVFGFAISPAYYLPMSVFSIAFGGKYSGFLIAMIDVFGYVGSLGFNYFGGSIAQDYGWTVFLAGLVTATLLALATMGSFLYLDSRARHKGRRTLPDGTGDGS